MNNDKKRLGLYFALEILLYAVLVGGYLFVVMHFFSGWILRTFQTSNRLYAVLALLLIVVQGLILDIITRTVLRSAHPKWK